MNSTSVPLWRHFAALIYESLILAAVSCLLIIPAALANLALHSQPWLARLAVSLIFLIGWQAYFALNWRQNQQTLAMRVWRLRLCNQEGCFPSKRQLQLRYLWSVVCLIGLPLLSYQLLRSQTPLPPHTIILIALTWWLLPWGFAVIHPSRQFLYDYLAGTRIINAQ